MNRYIITTSFILAVVLTSPVDAAYFYWQERDSDLVGQEKISLMVDTQGQSINAFEGTLIVPEGLTVRSTDDGGSIISLWIEKPPVSKYEMYFSGGLPGGYTGKAGKLFTLSFVADNTNEHIFEMKNFKAFINDGQATAANIENKKLALMRDENSKKIAVSKLDDLYPPEDFVPVISRQADTFYDKYFLVFSTTDKDSGIDHYEISEGGGQFVRAGSPYILKNQNAIDNVAVRALDRAGNIRQVGVNISEAINKRAEFGGMWLLSFGLLVGMLVASIIYNKHKK